MTSWLLLLSLLAPPQPAPPAASFDDLLAELAAKVAAMVSSADRVRVAVAADSTADPVVRPWLESDFIRRLEAKGIQADTSQATVAIRFACSTNGRERVCAAEVKRGDVIATSIVTGALQNDRVPEPRVILEIRHVFAQREPILDVAQIGDRLIVLDAEKLALYQRVDGAWQRRRSQAVTSSRVWPRDVRGRLRITGNALEAFLPGAVCRANVDAFAVSCADERQAWPLEIENTGIAAGRNYFTTPEGVAFYGYAALAAGAGAKWLVSAGNSRLVLLDEGHRPIDPPAGAGDDVAGVSACGPGAHALVGAAASDGRDAVRLFRIVDRRLIAVASPLVLPGALTTLWATSGATWATAIVRDAEAERYDALEINVACDR